MTITYEAAEATAPSSSGGCGALTKAGLPCSSPIVLDSGLCINHDPDRSAEVAEWRRLGGKGTSVEAQTEKALLKNGDLGALAHQLTLTIAELRAKDTSSNNGNAIASLARAYLQVREAALAEHRMERILRAVEDRYLDVEELEELGVDVAGGADGAPSG